MDKDPKYISIEHQELFERFLMGEMSAGERAIFSENLEENSALRTKFEDFKKLFLTVEEAGLRHKMEDFHKVFNRLDEGKVKQLIPFREKFYYGIAASIVVLIALGGFLYLNGSKDTRLFDEYYVPDPGLPTVMGNNKNYDFYEAMVAYKHGDYEDAISKWEKLLPARPQNDTLNYFLGSAYLAIDKEEESIKYFNKTVEDPNSTFIDETNFYLGMAHLKLGEKEIAKHYFEQSNYSRASQVLQKMTN